MLCCDVSFVKMKKESSGVSLEKLVIIPRTASELVGLQGLPTKSLARAKTG